ncbi:MAG TPA: excinuclease ABC subunit UvrA [Aggregatilineaceae bacterium]|nr:excinuclease ABC subunit UvrA [Aggregatilineaceae bacterium]
MQDWITIKGARLNNLKNVTIQIPKNKLVILTGLSGSGKSSLAFDTLHKECVRQYMESMGMVTDFVSKPEVDAIEGLTPSISVDQHLTNRSPRSTVGTATEIFTYLRVLFARVGHRPCPVCHQDIPPAYNISEDEEWSAESSESELEQTFDDSVTYPCPHCGTPVPEMGMAHFSFNKPAGACPTCSGLGEILDANLDLLLDANLSILDGSIKGWDHHYIAHYTPVLQAAAERYGFTFDPRVAVGDLSDVQRDLLLYGVHSPRFRQHFPDVVPPENVSEGRFEGIVTNILRRYTERAHDLNYREKMEKLLFKRTCPDCDGTRLRLESRQVTVNGRSITELSQVSLVDLAEWIAGLTDVLPIEAQIICEPIVADLRERTRRLVDIGVGYLTLERAMPSLSGGEAQRLRLASLLGSGLTGVLYVLDEPTIGLHPRDTERLIVALSRLRDLGNTVLVVEHDLDMIRAADYVIDIGPGAGKNGGRVVAAGTPDEIAQIPESVTGAFLTNHKRLSVERRSVNGRRLTIHGARAHNLRDITVHLPLGVLVAVTGVSGSGKSSLILDILNRAAQRHFYGAGDPPGEHTAITGWNHINKVITIDQTAIVRTTRSNAATYTDAFTTIRQVFAATPQACGAGLTAAHFSFNASGGRCERCQGAGTLTINMHFLPDVEVRCPVCRGKRFKPEVLKVLYRGSSIADVLDLTVEEALELFQDAPSALARLQLMVDVGLGYLKLGQPATTLSGGEAQRVKLAKELSRRGGNGHTLYLLDEPTTGLHPADTLHLLDVLQRLVDSNNTVVVIEHNLDVIAAADWIIDLGPEGGKDGGFLVAEGTPEQIVHEERSRTGAVLADRFASVIS